MKRRNEQMMKLGGIDEELEQEAKAEENVVSMEDAKKRRPFHYWEVSGQSLKLKLTTQMIEQLEKKYRCNMLTLITEGDIPPLSTMLTLLQAAMVPWQHGLTYEKVTKLYDTWFENGGNQMELFTNVVMPTLAVSGFFTEKQAEAMLNSMKNMDDLM